MSSPEEFEDHQTEHDGTSAPQVKKRRIQTVRACDRCRLKKIRCDGMPTLGSKSCSHCAAADSVCVFTPGVKQKRAPAKKYVDGLETRLERLEALLSRLHPDSDFSHELEGGPTPTGTGSASMPSPGTGGSHGDGSSRYPHVLFDETHDIDTHEERFVPSPELIESDEDDELVTDHVNVIRKLRSMNITGPLNRYYGRSSSVRLYHTALHVKSELSGKEQDILQDVLENAERRPDFWKLHPWERTRFSNGHRHSFVFPEPDLMHRLISTYFSFSHRLLPVLHRPSFEAQFAEGKHLTDEGFGSVLLLVCALGSRFVDDPRVLLDDPDKPGHPHSAGWTWFNQVQLVRNAALADPSLCDLQALALSIIFLSGMSPPQACWTLAGIGIRLAQDVGAHRRKTFYEHSFEGELWKRSFWALVTLDVWFSSFLGRPCAISLDSFDVDFPEECDDDYWTNADPSQAFKQPVGRPSDISFFVYWIKLHLIHSHALRTIYSLEKHKVIAKIGQQEWEKRVVSELDSALNRWFDSLPDQLRWDPNRENDVHFIQTVCLHASYHLVQMTIHRPFIPSSRKASSLSFPSLTICANSARACIHVLQRHERRIPGAAIMTLLIPAFMAGIVLLLRIWVAKQSGLNIDAEKEMADVYHAIKFIASGEPRWPLAGRFKDLLVTLSQVGDLPLPAASPTAKRARSDGDETPSVSRSSSTTQPSFPPTSGLAPAPSRNTPTTRSPPSSSCTGTEISTFGPPLAPHEDHRPSLDPAMALSKGDLFNAPLSGGVRSPFSAGAGGITSCYPSAGPSSVPSATSASLPSAFGAQQGPYQPMHDLYSLFGYQPQSGPPESYDTPTPPSAESSPAATLGLGTDLYGQYSGGPALRPDFAPTRAPADTDNADDLMNFFAPMVPQDGQMGVANEMFNMWSAMPTNYQSEDWEKYVSNMMGMTGGANVPPPVPGAGPAGQRAQHVIPQGW